jgi:hypothetical protein
MKTKPSIQNEYSPRHNSENDLRIDSTLHAFARAVPRPGLESRVASRLAAAPHLSRFQMIRLFTSSHVVVFQRVTVSVLATAGACAIVVGTVRHARHPVLPQSAAWRNVGNSNTAGKVFVPTHPVPAQATIDPSSPRTPAHGRARVSGTPPRRDGGAAYPRSPYPPDAQPESSSSQQ